MGCKEGSFDSNTMTLPTATNIKKGLFEESVPMDQVKMLYAIQNYNVTVSFSNLDANTQYSFYYYATTEDPSLTAESTAVRIF